MKVTQEFVDVATLAGLLCAGTDWSLSRLNLDVDDGRWSFMFHNGSRGGEFLALRTAPRASLENIANTIAESLRAPLKWPQWKAGDDVPILRTSMAPPDFALGLEGEAAEEADAAVEAHPLFNLVPGEQLTVMSVNVATGELTLRPHGPWDKRGTP